MKGKILVAYFSASGVTAKIAGELAETLGADLYEICPESVYTAADLNWMNKKSRSSLEMTDLESRPAIANRVPDMNQYQTVLVGFPIWWYVEPRIIDSFMESYDFSEKQVIPFATSGSSGIEQAQKRLETQYPQTVWKKGRLLREGEAKEWAKELLLKQDFCE